MNKIKVFTDSTNDLGKELIMENNISVVPLYVGFNDEVYKDGVDIDSELLYKKVEELNIIPKTSAPSPIDFYNSFKPYIDDGYDIIYIGLSSGLSATIQNAKLGANELEGNIKVIDSLNLATGVGILALTACDLIKEGRNIDEIEDEIVNKYRHRVNTSFVVDTLDYLHKGGRCSSVQSILGTALKIKPVIEVREGRLGIKKKVRGSREKIVKLMKKEIIDNIDSICHKRFFITHSKCDDFVYELRDELLKETSLKEVFITNTGSIISSHCGPGTLGLVYLEK